MPTEYASKYEQHYQQTLSHFPHVSHNCKFLCVNKTFQQYSYSHVDVIVMDILSKMHTSIGLSNPDE